MKTFFAAPLLCCAVLFSTLAEEKPADEAPAVLGKADATIIDGALDEAFWKSATPVRGDYINSKKGELSATPRLMVKYAWDEHYLYIGYETFDENLIAKASAIKEGPEKNIRMGCEIWSSDPKEKVDVVEFFITFGDEHFFWEIHHNAANQFNDVWCSVADPAWPIAKSSLSTYGIIFSNREFIADDGEFTVAMAVKLKSKADGKPSTVNASDDADTGYTAELRLPWGGLGAPAAAKPDPKKKETDWKMDGQKLLVLAVVQDGDLKERYHHSAPQRKGDWFHKTVPLWPKYQLAKTEVQSEKKPALLKIEELTAPQLAGEIFRRLDKHEPLGELMQPAMEGGMGVALACAAGLTAETPHRHETLYDIIAVASRCRRSHRELLRLYDPAAHVFFYTDAGAAAQKQLMLAFSSETWSRLVPEALVNAAPRPLLDWMRAEAASENPNLTRLKLIWREWGTSVFYRRERQHVDDVRAVILRLSMNAKICSDADALAALIRFAGETASANCSAFILQHVRHEASSVRAEAVLAIQRFGGEKVPTEILALAKTERDPAVLLRLAEATGEWRDDAAAGALAISLFQQHDNPEMRRALLFSAAHATWPQRSVLLLKAFDVPENGVLGVALQGVAEHPEKALHENTLALMNVFKTAPAALIEALGGLKDEKAAPYLIDALKQSKNLSVRLKIIFSLEKIGGAAASAALLSELKDTSNAMFAQQLIGIAGRMKLAGAEDLVTALAEDLTAPLPVRIQCLWSMGSLRSKTVHASLRRLDAKRDYYFGSADKSDSDAGTYEKMEQAVMLIKMALLQKGDTGAADEAAAIYARGTPTTKLSMLMLLADLKRDHEVIADGLKSADFSVMLAAVHAASAAAPKKYHATLVALENAPFIKAMIETGLDLNGLDDTLEHAIAAGK